MKHLRIAIITATAGWMTIMALWSFAARAQSQSPDALIATNTQEIKELGRRVNAIESMNISAEIATLKEFQRSTKETQDQNQKLLYGVFASVLTLAVERVWQIRANRRVETGE